MSRVWFTVLGIILAAMCVSAVVTYAAYAVGTQTMPNTVACKPATVILVISAGTMYTVSPPVIIPSGEARTLFLHSTLVVLDGLEDAP